MQKLGSFLIWLGPYFGFQRPVLADPLRSLSVQVLMMIAFVPFVFSSANAQPELRKSGMIMPTVERPQLASPYVAMPALVKRLPSTPFSVPITVDTAAGIISFQFNILYDPTLMHPSGSNFGCSTTATLAAGRSPICNVVPGDEGRLQVAIYGASPMTGTGAILNVAFAADPAVVSGNISPLSFESVSFFSDSGPVIYDHQNGHIQFLGPFTLTAPTINQFIPSTFVVPVTVDVISDLGINSFQFIVAYDPALLAPTGSNFGCSSAGTLSQGLSTLCNVVPGQEGILRVTAFGTAAITGSGTLLNLTFATAPGAFPGSSSSLTFQSVFFFNGSVQVPYQLQSGRVTLYGPTAATVHLGGRVLTSDGRGIRNATVVVSGNGLPEPRLAVTGPFGYYGFDGLAAGETYVVTVNSKRFTFTTPSLLISLTDDLANANFIADSQW